MIEGLGPEAQAVLAAHATLPLTVEDVADTLGLLDQATSLLGEVYADIRDLPSSEEICTADDRLDEAQTAIVKAAVALTRVGV